MNRDAELVSGEQDRHTRFVEDVRRLSSELSAALDSQDVNDAFRAVHSIKSIAAQAGIDDVAADAHDLETVLEERRREAGAFGDPVRRRVRTWLLALDGKLGEVEGSLQAEHEPESQSLSAFQTELLAESVRRGERVYRLECAIDPESPLKIARAYLVSNNLETIANVIKTDPSLSETDESKFRRFSVLVTADVEESLLYEAANVDEIERIRLERIDSDAVPRDRSVASEATTAETPYGLSGPYRVDARTMEWLVSQLDEADAWFSNLPAAQRTTLARIQTILGSVRDSLGAVQRRPIGGLFETLEKTALELAEQSGKTVEVSIAGGDVVVDSRLLEARGDPLLHLVRNAIDHGIETREDRVQIGKAAQGRLELAALEGETDIEVRISDDGHGIDRALIEETARKRNLVVSGEESILDIVGLPGFSTVEAATDISGRGFGLDIVLQRARGIGGKVTIESDAGLGTTVSIVVPKGKRGSGALVVRVEGRYYAVPGSSVERMVPFDVHALKRDRGGGVWFDRVPIFRIDGRMRVEKGVPRVGMLVLIRYLDKTGWLYVDDILFERAGSTEVDGDERVLNIDPSIIG